MYTCKFTPMDLYAFIQHGKIFVALRGLYTKYFKKHWYKKLLNVLNI